MGAGGGGTTEREGHGRTCCKQKSKSGNRTGNDGEKLKLSKPLAFLGQCTAPNTYQPSFPTHL